MNTISVHKLEIIELGRITWINTTPQHVGCSVRWLQWIMKKIIKSTLSYHACHRIKWLRRTSKWLLRFVRRAVMKIDHLLEQIRTLTVNVPSPPSTHNKVSIKHKRKEQKSSRITRQNTIKSNRPKMLWTYEGVVYYGYGDYAEIQSTKRSRKLDMKRNTRG